jgi:hypothetical protein
MNRSQPFPVLSRPAAAPPQPSRPPLRPGQTLLETVLAAGVITASVVGSMTVIISTISVGQTSQSQVEAANFAREGVEVVRGIRDSNWLKREQNVADGSAVVTSWDDDGTTAGYQAMGPLRPYTATYQSSSNSWLLRRCAAPTCTDTETTVYQSGPLTQPNYFTQDSSTCTNPCRATRYHRVITITKVSNESTTPNIGTLEYLDVVVEVFWRERTGRDVKYPGFNRRLTAEERLYDWR